MEYWIGTWNYLGGYQRAGVILAAVIILFGLYRALFGGKGSKQAPPARPTADTKTKTGDFIPNTYTPKPIPAETFSTTSEKKNSYRVEVLNGGVVTHSSGYFDRISHADAFGQGSLQSGASSYRLYENGKCLGEFRHVHQFG